MEVQKVQEKGSEFLKIEKNHPNSERFKKTQKITKQKNIHKTKNIKHQKLK